jgi:Arc/MetJ family transcription regulator
MGIQTTTKHPPNQRSWLTVIYTGNTVVHMKTMIDLDDAVLELAAKELGTTTKKATVNAALAFVVQRKQRIAALLAADNPLGIGTDIGDADIMRRARR